MTTTTSSTSPCRLPPVQSDYRHRAPSVLERHCPRLDRCHQPACRRSARHARRWLSHHPHPAALWSEARTYDLTIDHVHTYYRPRATYPCWFIIGAEICVPLRNALKMLRISVMGTSLGT